MYILYLYKYINIHVYDYVNVFIYAFTCLYSLVPGNTARKICHAFTTRGLGNISRPSPNPKLRCQRSQQAIEKTPDSGDLAMEKKGDLAMEWRYDWDLLGIQQYVVSISFSDRYPAI